jgi:hypothetical protein
MQLPYGLELSQMQTKWRSILNPLIGNPSLQSVILSNIPLVSGSNPVNHTLGRKLTGWRIIRINAAATIYDTQDQNTMPDLTLLLTSSAPCVVSLEVF